MTAPDPTTWYAYQFIDAPRIKTNLTDYINQALTAIAGYQGAAVSATIASGTNAITGSVTFGTAYASGVQPKVVASPNGSTNHGVNVNSITNTGFSWRIFTTDGTNVASNLAVAFNWIAMAL